MKLFNMDHKTQFIIYSTNIYFEHPGQKEKVKNRVSQGIRPLKGISAIKSFECLI